MDLRHLRCFVVLGEELHFTRAAARLGIRQPPLSIQIKQLEHEIGTPLFRRLSRGVEMTVAGEAFLQDAKAILNQLDRAVTDAESLARGQTGRIRLGFAGATYLPPEVPDAILQFRERCPGVELSPEQSNTPALITALQAKTVDVAFIRTPFHAGNEIRVESFFEEDMLAVLPAHHALASKQAVALRDSAQEVFILFPREIGPGLHDSIIAACVEAGFSANLGQAASQIISAVPMVAAGFGVSIVPASVAALEIGGVAFCKLRGTGLRAPISLAWRHDDRSPALHRFLTTLRAFKAGLPKRAKPGRHKG